MIVTVKAWLHAEVNYKGEIEYKLHGFGSALNPRDIPLREMSFDVIVEESEHKRAHQLALKQELHEAENRVKQLKNQLETFPQSV